MAVIAGKPVGGGPGPARCLFLVVALTSALAPAQSLGGELRMVLVTAERVRSMEANQRVVTGLLKAAFEDVEAAGEILGKKGDLEPVLEIIAGMGRVSYDLATPSRETTDGVTVPLIGLCGEAPRGAWTSGAVRSGFLAKRRIDRLVGLVQSFDLDEARRAVASALSRLEGLEGTAGEAEVLLARAESDLVRAMGTYETGVAGPFTESLAGGVARLQDASVVSELCLDRESQTSTAPADRDTDSRDDAETPDLQLAQVTRAGALGAIQASLAALDAAVLPEGSSPQEIARGFRGPVQTRAVPPVYSNFARRACMEGEVRLELGIDRDGIPRRIRVLRGSPELSESAIAAAEQWKFEPASLDGRAVAFDYRLTVNFDLQGAEATRCRQLRASASSAN